MKKLLALVVALSMSMSYGYAANTANIKINIAGAIHDNTYFLCMPDMGCLSILAAKKGKIYSMMNPIEMNTLFVTDTSNMSVFNQGLPSSCNVSVKPSQTITIYGNLEKRGDKVTVNNLRCTITG